MWPRGPRKVARVQCEEKFTKASAKIGADAIFFGLRWWLKEWAKEQNRFVPLPATWLNQARWEAAEGEPETIQEPAEIVRTRIYLEGQTQSAADKAAGIKAALRLREIRAGVGR